jgi:hypothetical protein
VGGEVDPAVAEVEPPLEHPAASSGTASAARSIPVLVRLLIILPPW